MSTVDPGRRPSASRSAFGTTIRPTESTVISIGNTLPVSCQRATWITGQRERCPSPDVQGMGTVVLCPRACLLNPDLLRGAETTIGCVVVLGSTTNTTVVLRLAGRRLDHRSRQPGS